MDDEEFITSIMEQVKKHIEDEEICIRHVPLFLKKLSRHLTALSHIAANKYKVECEDCKVEYPPMFLVHDELWLEAADKRDFLCLECFEKRLGRQIKWSDLKPKAGLTAEAELGVMIHARGD